MWATDAEVMPTARVDADPRLGDGCGLPVADVLLDNAFAGWRGEATIIWPERGARLVLDADVPLGFLVVYSPAGKEYFCVEPVSHCTDAFNLAAQGRADTGMLTLEPGATLSAVMRLRPSLE
jgi:aldose 1-epimerase